MTVSDMTKRELTQKIRQLAEKYGFDTVGIARAEVLSNAGKKLDAWLKKDMHGEMSYLKDRAVMRTDPSQLLPGAKSVICLLHNYYNPQSMASCGFSIAKYAFGKDYHNILRRKLKSLTAEFSQDLPDCNSRICVDSAPIMEKIWAEKSGLGWIGKNGCLIAPKKGSFYFLSEIIVDIELDYDHPATDHCGTCTVCLEKCPTGAIVEPYVVDARKCISYLTIECKSEIPQSFQGKYKGWIFGCDICQDVCPHNSKPTLHTEPTFMPKKRLTNLCREDWRTMSEETFNDLFAGTPFKRTKYSGLMRNIEFLDNT